MKIERFKQERYSSKERVLRAFHRDVPDRVPINYFANAGIDRRLKAAFGLQPDDGEGLRQALGVDFAGVGANYAGPRLHPEIPGRGVCPMSGIRTQWIEHESGGYWDFCDFPLKDADLETVENWPLPSPDDFAYTGIKQRCLDAGNRAIHVGGPGLGDVINSSGFLRGTEQVLVDLITDDPAGLRLIQRRADLWLEVTRRSLEAAEGLVDFVWLGEDLGSQHSPLISLELFRKHIRPIHQRFIDLAKSHKLPVMIHSCGSSSWAYDDFIEMGIDVVDTLQPEAVNMSPAYLKGRYGGRLAFHGCISTAGPVAYATPKEVDEYCRQTLETMMPGGGYCFAPTHSLQDNSPTENVLAMYQAAFKHGWY